MFGKGIRLFRILGFEVRIDASWLLLAVLIIVSLTTGYFPMRFKDLSPADYWVMGIIGALGLFASIIFHELCHSLVARRFGMEMKGISLFIFGGVAQMKDEARSPKAEFWMAIAGPIASIVLALVFGAASRGAQAVGWSPPVAGVLGYLAWINMILAVFNMLPAFPLDGGRVLRSALWAWRKDLRWATHVASSIGAGFGVVLIVLGIFSLLGGNVVGGLWWCLIGMFLRGVSHASYRQLVIKTTLSGEHVRRFMRADPVTVTPDVTLSVLVEQYIYEYHFKMFPVVAADGRLQGCISTREVKSVPRPEWTERRVGDLAEPVGEENSVGSETDAADALALMNRTGRSRLLVVEQGRLLGIVSLKDLLKFLSLKLDLEGGSRGPTVDVGG